MREFELYGTVRAVVCICDSLNYLLEEADLLEKTFRLVNNYLDPGGLFVCSISTRSINTKRSSGIRNDRGEPGGLQLHLGEFL